MPSGDWLRKLIAKKTFDFSEEDRAAKGKALINIVSVATGEVAQAVALDPQRPGTVYLCGGVFVATEKGTRKWPGQSSVSRST